LPRGKARIFSKRRDLRRSKNFERIQRNLGGKPGRIRINRIIHFKKAQENRVEKKDFDDFRNSAVRHSRSLF
jgi:hypothetical protein